MLGEVDADGGQRLQIDFLRIAGVGLEDDLILVMLLHTVRVLPVAPIIRANGGFDVSDIPRFWTQHAQKGGGIHGACADFFVVGLPDHTAPIGPELLEGGNDGLKIGN